MLKLLIGILDIFFGCSMIVITMRQNDAIHKAFFENNTSGLMIYYSIIASLLLIFAGVQNCIDYAHNK